jgi:peptidoglycan/LPS O-acetylase OafA/YrhL
LLIITVFCTKVLRLHPPYLAALALTLIVTAHLSIKLDTFYFLKMQCQYLKVFFYFTFFWVDNPVLWTPVEAQYYVFIDEVAHENVQRH